MRKTGPPALTRRESQIMEILHRRRRATVEEIRGELPNAPGASSVRKLLDIMLERGHVGREAAGPGFAYFPAVRPEEARRSALRGLLRTFFDDSPRSLISTLLDLSGKPIPPEEYERLAALLDETAHAEEPR
ncbi:MAG TPA: BlaI/MecI/CopY family transcriptional regulator [Longimicrobiaceae bacterium]|nr:BlaI/MecI/CopY family transcriptional regulator [Longimicrobiaceae bacterium]